MNRTGKDFWGPPTWTTLHILGYCSTPETSEYYEKFWWLLTKLLPCMNPCAKNLESKLSRLNMRGYLKSQGGGFLLSYIIHDMANQNINKYQSGTVKVSPPLEKVKEMYQQGMKKGPTFWGPPIWTTIHSIAVTLLPQNAKYFKKLLQVLTYLLPDMESRELLKKCLERHDIDPYLRNFNDTFFYTYMLHKIINRQIGDQNSKVSPDFQTIKTFYYAALGQECDDCKV